jgi:hypothetical protein
MFRTKKTMLQRWDECITRYLERAADEQATAARLDTLAGSVVGKWLHRFQLHDRATRHRATGMDYLEHATRMANCPHNPRHGGQGWKPEKGFFEVFTVRDVTLALLWLAINLTAGITVMFGVIDVIVGRGMHLPADSPQALLVPLEAAGAGLWAVMITTWTMNAVLDAPAIVTRYVRGGTR